MAAFVMMATAGARADQVERLTNEIANLRALPSGFAAWCDGGTLRFGRAGSGTYRVTDAAVCRLVPDGDFVCTTDPHRETQPNGGRVASCSTLERPAAGDAI